MGYSLLEVSEKVNALADKLGSDFFPRPVMLTVFETSSLDFIGERLKLIEKNQEISDDISNLITPKKIQITPNPDANFPDEYIAPIPVDYMRLLSYGVIYNDNTQSRRTRLMKNSQYEAMKLDANNRPNKFYPIIVQSNSIWKVYSGSVDTPNKLKIVYCKLPSFAEINQLNTRIINLSDEAVEKIIYMTCTKLFNVTADQRTESNYKLQEAFRKVFS